MKKIFILFFLVFMCNISYSQKILKIIFTGDNSDFYYSSYLFISGYRQNDIISYAIPDEIIKIYSDTIYKYLSENDLKKYYKIILRIKTPTKEYDIHNFYTDLKQTDFKKIDTITYILNYDNLGYREEAENQKKIESEKEEKHNIKLSIFKNTALEYVSYYQNKINGKTYNKISDILYEEGFKRDYYTSSSGNFITRFRLTYNFDTPEDEKYLYSKDYITIEICLWHSFGYGKLIYSVDYIIQVDKKLYKSD